MSMRDTISMHDIPSHTAPWRIITGLASGTWHPLTWLSFQPPMNTGLATLRNTAWKKSSREEARCA
ncbi:uncharacterized protein SEPMUDRAFT_151947 [Sphaerulina musiva SO2202]|uniref:Uncharacterized protein n=1 Tax=Sphaerulina musiva (strain SO2202) TaxID=692275 RepID=M3CZM6_SPHMS|nr:uncharacterized protein SEPMUDRAFT_151947 [Sphaerulina musiva SO2202]EMF09126.1 hypothetical protein SEPMUDRAFT_151947 [Sphaerulina musiva SO2202]